MDSSMPRLKPSVPLLPAAGACASPAKAPGSMPICWRALVENGAGPSPLGVHFMSIAPHSEQAHAAANSRIGRDGIGLRGSESASDQGEDEVRAQLRGDD
eukprot:7285829-Prymnesium_polylepis.1